MYMKCICCFNYMTLLFTAAATAAPIVVVGDGGVVIYTFSLA